MSDTNLDLVARLLVKIQSRVNFLTKRLTAVSDVLTTQGGIIDSLLEHKRLMSTKMDEMDKMLEGGKRQKELNAAYTESLYKLRDSMIKAFGNVRDENAAIIRSIQTLNERISKLESQVPSPEFYDRVENLENIKASMKNLFEAINR